jgi:GDP-L-fucose synthase
MESPPDWVNVGTGEDIAILDLAREVAAVTGFKGEILTDPTKPDGTPRKLMDVSRLTATGWKPSIPFRDGLAGAYEDFLSSLRSGDVRG